MALSDFEAVSLPERYPKVSGSLSQCACLFVTPTYGHVITDFDHKKTSPGDYHLTSSSSASETLARFDLTKE